MGFKIFVPGTAFAVHLEPLESACVSKRTKLKFISSISSSALIALTFRNCPSVRSFVINERVYVLLSVCESLPLLLESVFVKKCLNLYIDVF